MTKENEEKEYVFTIAPVRVHNLPFHARTDYCVTCLFLRMDIFVMHEKQHDALTPSISKSKGIELELDRSRYYLTVLRY